MRGTKTLLSSLYAPTLKETPNDADIVSHKLLLRGGFIRKSASGIYTFLPLGWKVLAKIEDIVREEMNAIGAQEIMMPALQSAEIWHESGRWNDYGPELMRLHDRHDREFCLGPTHEELITTLVRDELNSYKQLPTCLYQIQMKFRDEIRPRFGLLRSREFIMKDAYSFHANQESLQKTYDEMSVAYGNICDRCGLKWRGVEADSGRIGGKVTTEFMALANSGEAELVHCECGYAANTEAGECLAHPTEYEIDHMEKISTPGVHTIEELSEFLNCPESSCVKALSCKDSSGDVYVLFVPGDHEVNEVKAARVVDGFEILTDDEMKDLGLPKGSMGCVGLPDGVKIVADNSLKAISRWVVGANEDGYHIVGAELGEDFNVDVWTDLCVVKPGDACPNCGKTLSGDRGIEVSQVFQLGTKYSESMNATYLDEEGKAKPFIMGCYGVGVTRTLAAVVEQHSDDDGIIWPYTVAPAHICIIVLDESDEGKNFVEQLIEHATFFGFDVVVDDRKERAGVKFADSDLIGWPLQIIVGKRGVANGEVEIKNRASGKRQNVDLSDAISSLEKLATDVRNTEITPAEDVFSRVGW